MFNDKILYSIKNIISNYRVYLVGGYLRNFYINNQISNDRDLVCINNPLKLAKDISEKLNGTLIELDKENEIYRVVLKDKQNYFDISLALENDILKDAKRRDFTINSIYFDLNKEEIFDPLGGIPDIENRILKTYNLENLKQDPLRLLRLYRFMSSTGFSADVELINFVKDNFNLLKNIAKERINYEIIQIFSGKFLNETLIKMYDDEILEKLFPFVKEIKRIPNNSHHHLDLIHHSIETVNNIKSNNALLKIAAFYHDIGKPSTWTIEPIGRHRFIGHDIKGAEIAKSELKNLNFSNKQISYITKMIRYHIYPCSLINCADNKKAFARFIKKLEDLTPDVIELARADRLSAQGEAITQEMIDITLKHLDNLLNFYIEIKKTNVDFKPLLNGNEIIELLNIKPSKQVGIILESIKEAQLSGEITTKKEAVEYVKQKAVKLLTAIN